MTDSLIKFNIKIKSNFKPKGIEDAIKRPEKFLKDVQTFRRNAFQVSMASNKDATGKRVRPLTMPYRAIKSRKYGDRSIRVASGSLLASYDSYVNGNELTEFLDSPIAIFHQEGTSKMPQRQLLPESWEDLPADERKMIESLANKFLGDVLDSLARGSFS